MKIQKNSKISFVPVGVISCFRSREKLSEGISLAVLLVFR